MRSLIEPGGGEQFSMLEQRRASWLYVLSINCIFYIDTFSYFFNDDKRNAAVPNI